MDLGRGGVLGAEGCKVGILGDGAGFFEGGGGG